MKYEALKATGLNLRDKSSCPNLANLVQIPTGSKSPPINLLDIWKARRRHKV